MARSLQTYRAKRNFKASPEPDAPEVKHKRDTKQPPALKFVVQCHSARRLHYDFRLEFAGVLLSWAVTRGPSANPATRRLAVRTEDHPLDYAGFEGVIPKGSYGAGPVMIWDRGTWTAAGDAGRGLAEGHLKVVLAGERMRGLWALVRLKDDGSRENWLLIKDRDAFAEADDALTERFTDSVVSSRGFPDIAAGKPAKSPKPAVWPPRFVPCMLCETVKTAPEGNDWQFEMKYDGYRLQLALGEASAVLRTRNGLDWTDRFPDVANAARSMKLADSILDGEAVILNAAGISDYPALVAALGRGGAGIGFVVFDVLRDRGKDLRSLSLAQRRRALEKLFAKYGPKTDVIRLAPALTGDGKLLLERIVAAGGEGLIAKRTTSTYQSRRSSSWLKIKGVQRIEATVIGWMPSPAGRKFASLLLAVPTQDGLRYAGRVGSGFGGQTESDAFDRLERIERKTPPRDIQGLELPSGVHWVAPRLVAEIGFGGFTGEGRLRAARFVRWKTAAPGPKPEVAGGTMRPAKSLASSDAGPVTITHPARVVFPQISFTKGDVAAYYAKVSPRMLPYLAGRPVSVLRAPDGIDHETFFQRHPMPAMTRGIDRVAAPDGDHAAYFAIRDATGLASAVQFGAIEFHGWGARLPNLDSPDRMVFDLDPADDVPFSAVVTAADVIRLILESAGLKSFPLLSGGKGVHLVVPLTGPHRWSDVETFTQVLAQVMARAEPNRYVAVMSKARRTGRIYIDWLRNKPTATAVAPYSLRARDTASIAAPVSWQQLRLASKAALFTARTSLPAGEPWRGFFSVTQVFSQKVLKLLLKQR